MKLLILGGTIFLGRHIVRTAIERGHDVTLFNRGKTNPDLFPDIRKIQGDRKEDDVFDAFRYERFDAIVDTSGYIPRVVGNSARALASHADRYCFISSVSVYRDWPEFRADEYSAVATIDNPETEEVTGATYGALKALCEARVEQEFPGSSLIVRPGLIVGPDDPTDRFAYWPNRIARGGAALAPGSSETPTQWIDVRDLASWIVSMLEQSASGVYNADGPVVSLGELLDACQAAAPESDARVVYVDETFLQEQGVAPWSELPLWIPGLSQAPGGGATVIDRAVGMGLSHRPVAETVADTLAWDKARPQENAWRATLKPEKEAQVLDAWESSIEASDDEANFTGQETQ